MLTVTVRYVTTWHGYLYSICFVPFTPLISSVPFVPVVPSIPSIPSALADGKPFLVPPADLKCKITIRTTGMGLGETDTWSWGKFWEVGAALVGVCVSKGKEGVQTRLGGFLFFFFFLPPPRFFPFRNSRRECLADFPLCVFGTWEGLGDQGFLYLEIGGPQ